MFQRVDDGSVLWKAATGSGYDTWLAEDELRDLRVLFQRRHLLQHREGMVDQTYIDRSDDRTYRVGQRIIVRPDDVLRLLDLVAKLAAGMRSTVK